MVEGLDDIKKTLSGVKKVPSATKVVVSYTYSNEAVAIQLLSN